MRVFVWVRETGTFFALVHVCGRVYVRVRVCVCVCVSVSVCACGGVGVCATFFAKGNLLLFLLSRLYRGKKMGRSSPAGFLPMKTPPWKGVSVNVQAVVHLDGRIRSWWPH